MNGAAVLRFLVLLAAGISFFAGLNFFDDWTLQLMPIRFVGAAFASGITLLAAVWHFPPKIAIRQQAILFWGIALILRIIALPLMPADDLIRYQFEGKIQRAGFNPYLTSVSDPQLDDLRRDFPEAVKINHPELRAFDAPGAELLFKFLSGITGRPLFYKMIFAVADLAVATVLLRLIGGAHRYRDAAWYAWNPLVVYSFAGAAHFDSVMNVSLVTGILALVRSTSAVESNAKWLWAVAAALFFGIAISLNLAAASLLLLFVFALRWRAFVLPLAATIPVCCAVPFGFPRVRIWDSLIQLTQLSRLNDLSWWLIEDTFWPNPHQRVFHYLPIIIACVVAVSFLFVRNWKRGMVWVLGTVLALTPILYPWYCTWILPIAAWRRTYGWHVLSITIFAYYLFWDERLFALPWHADPWMRALIIAPVLAVLVMLTAQKRAAPPAS